jgi:hypothetical protein
MSRATAFKGIASNDYKVTPYNPYSSIAYTYVSGSTNNSLDLKILKGTHYTGSIVLRDANNEEYNIYDSIVNIFYSSGSFTTYGLTYNTYVPLPSSSIYVVSITKDVFGNTIVPLSFKFGINSVFSYDDGRGNLYVSESGVGYNIGNLFYDKGIAVFKAREDVTTSIDKDGLCVVDTTPIQTEFSSSVTLYENILRVEISPGEFNISPYNPSVLSSSIFYQQNPLSMSSAPMIDYMFSRSIGVIEPSSSMVPYITSIGFYNSDNDLLAVAKLSNPVKRTLDVAQTFIVKFDT